MCTGLNSKIILFMKLIIEAPFLPLNIFCTFKKVSWVHQILKWNNYNTQTRIQSTYLALSKDLAVA